MKQLLTLFACLLMASAAMAQSDVVTAGGTASGAGGSATYTVGQIAVQRAGAGDKYIIEGVQQPYEFQTVGVDNYPGITLNAILFPNPTQHYVQLRITNFDMPENGLKAQLYDANGRLLQIFNVTDFETRMDMEQYPTATYQLRILDGQKLLKTFKVVKTKW